MNDARPYSGGDPYADYRGGEFAFTDLVDLADRRLGGSVIAANDEFFAERENLLRPEPAHFDPEAFGHKGKVMDGWETRRRRGAGADDPHPGDDDHDWALIRLGAPGVVRGVIVDTAHFRGNYPQQVAIEAAHVDGAPSPERLLADDVTWVEIVPRSRVRGMPPTASRSMPSVASPTCGSSSSRWRHRPAPRPRRGRRRSGLDRRAGHRRPGRVGERRRGRGRLGPLLLLAGEHDPPGPLAQDGRRLGEPAPTRPGQ